MQASGPLRGSDRHAFGEHPQGELSLVEINTHVAKRPVGTLGPGDTATLATESLIAFAVFPVLLSIIVLACWGDHRESAF